MNHLDVLETYGKIANILGSLKVTKSTRATRMHHTLQILGTVERLLFLEQENIASNRNSANRLAMSTAKADQHPQSRHLKICNLRIRPRDTLIARKVGAVVLTLPALNCTRDLGRDIRRPFISRAHVALPRCTLLSAHTLDALRDGLEGVLSRVVLGSIRTGRHGCGGKFSR